MADVKITLTHNGIKYHAGVCTIESTQFGWEDHDILTCHLRVRASGVGGSIGGYVLDSYDKALRERVATGEGLAFLMRVMKTVGVREWESLPGKRVLVLTESEYGWPPVGIANVDSGEAFIFKELWSEH